MLPVLGLSFHVHDWEDTRAVVCRDVVDEILPDVTEKRCHIALNFVPKHSSTAESSDNDKTYVLPDENFITVGVERFRFTEVLFQASVST